MRDIPGVEERPSQWGADPAFWIDNREFVHVHAGEVEIRVTRRRMRDALSDPRVVRRTPTSDWVQVPIGESALAQRLARVALDANRRRPAGRGQAGGR